MIPFYEEKHFNIRTIESFGINFPPHLHSAVELMLIESGSLSAVCDGKEYILNAGDFLICFPNTIHSYSASPDSVHYHMAICHPRFIGDYLNELMNFTPECPVIRKEKLHSDIAYAMRGLFLDSRDEGVCKAFTQLILARTVPLLALERDLHPRSSELTSRVVEYISKNFKQPLSLDAVAKEVGASKCHLSHVFSSKLHTSFNDYLNSLRLNSAQNMLRNTDKDILAISLECGFESQRTFNRAFKRLYLTTPSEYRESCKNS